MKRAILWFRRDLRLVDHAALDLARDSGRQVVAVFTRDGAVTALGRAAKLRLEMALAALDAGLRARGSRLLLRCGDPAEVLLSLARESGADQVLWQRRYDPAGMAKDRSVKERLKAEGIEATSVAGFTLFEPFEIASQKGTPFRVFTPFWQALSAKRGAIRRPTQGEVSFARCEFHSENLADWRLGAELYRARHLLQSHQQAGFATALDRLFSFRERLPDYAAARDRLDLAATSALSDSLAFGEIAPHRIWQALEGVGGAEPYLRQLAWRDFAWHLAYHTPELLGTTWRAEWQSFPWEGDSDRAEAWRWGQTGIDIIDAAMRELWITGRMHNRARMIVASYLTKHLMTDWRIGQAWFADTLTDWDDANNAMGWQWVAGSGPDAAPYFRIFNPESQAEKFDPDGTYRQKWLNLPDFAAMVPLAKGEIIRPTTPIVGLAEGRARALAAYESWRKHLPNPGEGGDLPL